MHTIIADIQPIAMLTSLLNRFTRKREEQPEIIASTGGRRVYAIGDIHGRLDLFSAMIDLIEEDHDAKGDADSLVILLGDLVDRGPASRGVIDAAREWKSRREVRILKGNHEEMFLRSLNDVSVLRHFLRHGGKETTLSYGMSTEEYRMAELEMVQSALQSLVPQADIDFIDSFEDHVTVGDYLFVHAGILPGIPLEEQTPIELRWIREPFLSHSAPHSHVVVHGHTITAAPVDRGNRIGIDTGAYESGCLTALVLEGETRRYIQTGAD